MTDIDMADMADMVDMRAERGNLRPVDIIIPVYRGLAASKRCLESVAAHTDFTNARLLVVDDATPEPTLKRYCIDFATRPGVVLLTNEENRGFVASVNRGMSYADNRDVVLLNSDTEVPPGWLQRLQACAMRAPDIATATPFSNNGSICSYPYFCESAALPEGLSTAALDGWFQRANAGVSEELPTAVGFCMYIRREALDAIGLFDEERYGRGYGEENDFSLRAHAVGWRNLLCADLFVYHEGSVSFGDERFPLMAAGTERLAEFFPHYAALVADFVAADPLQPYRQAVDDLRARQPGQLPLLLGEARHVQLRLREERLALQQQRAREAAILHDQLSQVRERAAQQVDEIRALRQRCADYDQRCEKYDRRCETYQSLLQRERDALQRTSAGLAHAQALVAAAQTENAQLHAQLDGIARKWYVRLGRKIKRTLGR